MNPTSKEAVLERERRWSRLAGIVAFAAIIISIASIIIQQRARGSGTSDADHLTDVYQHPSAFLASAVLEAVGLALLIVPLYFLFSAAAARAPRMRRGLAVLIFIGPICLGAQLVIGTIGLRDVADKFHVQAPAVEQQARQAQRRQGNPAATGGNSKSEAASKRTGSQAPSTTTTTTSAQTSTTATTTATTGTGTTTTGTITATTPAQAASDAADTLASNLADDSGTLKASQVVGAPGGIGLVIAIAYTALWAMRTGLLTRFWGSLGIALGVSLLFFGLFGILLWFFAIGLMLVGRWPGGRPPAWEAGVAVPWPRPGEPPPDASTLEGSGRELSERPLPEEEAPGRGPPTEGGEPGLPPPAQPPPAQPPPAQPPPAEPPPVGPDGLTQGQRRKKRKRRG